MRYLPLSDDDRAPAADVPAVSESSPGRVEIPLPIEGGSAGDAPRPGAVDAALPPPRVSATGTGALSTNPGGGLLVPVQGVTLARDVRRRQAT